MHLCSATAAQPQKQRGKKSQSNLPDISELTLQLQQQWHPDNNALLGSIKVKPHSKRKVLWSCSHCPAGWPHIWLAAVKDRTAGQRCPYCRGRKLCKHNSLATKAPTVARYWDHSKNDSTSEQTLAGSNSSANWKCPDCQHEWQAQIATRVLKDAGCPQCRYRNTKYSKQPTFQEAQHSLLLEWDHERNALDDIHPHNTTLQSHKLVHWICDKCPKGRLHRYQKRAHSRTRKRAEGCPYCASRKICDCNSLAACSPSIAAEWDFVKNDASPADVTSRSHQVVWWRNASRGSWKQRVQDRTKPCAAAQVLKLLVCSSTIHPSFWVITAAVTHLLAHCYV